MTFEQVMTVVAVAVGPAGIGLGWWLSELGTTKRAKEATKEQEEQERAARSIRLLTAAATVERQGRTLAQVAYDQGALGRHPNEEQVAAFTNTLNSGMGDLSRLILEAEVFGPDGLANIGRTLQTYGLDLVNVLHAMNSDLLAVDVEKVQNETIPAFQAAIKNATGDVRALLVH
ncbi:hypothetical protein ACFVDI_14210 [Nocardioides sp. NPDC057767]|uniref:hypothetical protein n=1 Tax=unclassified Nocardioides TaxID=2615069 RepID=UPI00366FB873